MSASELCLRDCAGRLLARCQLRGSRLRRWHFGFFALLGGLSAYHWFGLTEAGLALLAGYARGQAFLPPRELTVVPGRRLWMCPQLVVIPRSWGRCHTIYADELSVAEYVRLRRLLRRAALQPKREPLDLPSFEWV
ncbi:MAG: hypothetical protein ACR2PZ_20765 [Pseudomonadales bacterium]